VLWHYDDLGVGHSSPAFTTGKIYISAMEDQTGILYAFNQDGSLIWKVPYGTEYYESYPGSRATPVVAGDHVYMLSGKGDLACLNANTGVKIWGKNIFDEFGGRNITWGINETLIIHGNKLICTPGGTKNNVVALDKLNGSLLWSVKAKGEKSAYCSPLLVEIGGRNLLVTHTANNILGIDADKGELLWTYPQTNRYSVHANTPLYHDGQLFCFSGYGQGGVMLELNSDGSKVGKKWFSNTMDSRMGGAVLIDGYIYGSGDKNREWQCIDWETGKTVYESTEFGNGVVIAADGMLFCYSQRGEIGLVKANPSGFDLISRARVTYGKGQHWAHPVINEGRLFIRHGNSLVAYKIK
jgi:outer membrane protein assembly factor BamB